MTQILLDDLSSSSEKSCEYEFSWVTKIETKSTLEEVLGDICSHDEMQDLVQDVAKDIFDNFCLATCSTHRSDSRYNISLSYKINPKGVKFKNAPSIKGMLDKYFDYHTVLTVEEQCSLDSNERVHLTRSRRSLNRELKVYQRRFYQDLARRVLPELQRMIVKKCEENRDILVMEARMDFFSGPPSTLCQIVRSIGALALCCIPIVGNPVLLCAWGNSDCTNRPYEEHENYSTWQPCVPDTNEFRGVYSYYRINLYSSVKPPIFLYEDADD